MLFPGFEATHTNHNFGSDPWFQVSAAIAEARNFHGVSIQEERIESTAGGNILVGYKKWEEAILRGLNIDKVYLVERLVHKSIQGESLDVDVISSVFEQPFHFAIRQTKYVWLCLIPDTESGSGRSIVEKHITWLLKGAKPLQDHKDFLIFDGNDDNGLFLRECIIGQFPSGYVIAGSKVFPGTSKWSPGLHSLKVNKAWIK